jgi:hypothetical protein
MSALETAVWEQTYIEWKNVVAYLTSRPTDKHYATLEKLSEGVIMDNPGVLTMCVGELSSELAQGNYMQHIVPKLNPAWYSESKAPPRELEFEVPSELQLYCNMFEAYNTRRVLIRNM